MGSSLKAADKQGDGAPKAVSAGDGSEDPENGYHDQYKRIWVK